MEECIMKKSDEWITQSVFDRAANECLKKLGGDLDLLNANQVAVFLGRDRANEANYALYEDWKQRQLAQGRQCMNLAPPTLRPALTTRLTDILDTAIDLVIGLSGKAIAEDREEAAKNEAILRKHTESLEDKCTHQQEQFEQAEREMAAMEEELEKSRADLAAQTSRAERLEARLEEVRSQYDKLLASLSKPASGEGAKDDRATPDVAEDDALEGLDMSRYDYEG